MAKSSQKTLESTLRLTNIGLLLSGIEIFENDSGTLWKHFIYFLYYFNYTFVYFDVIGEFWWLFDSIQAGKSILELSLIAPCFTVSLLSTAKTMPLFNHRHVALKLVKKLRDMHPTDSTENRLNGVEEKIVNESMKILNFVILLLYYISCLVTVSFTLLPAASMAYDYYTTGETEYKYPYLVKYSFNPYTKVLWPFLYLHQMWSTVIVAVNVFAADTLFYALCVYIQMHFRILCHHLENMKTDSSEDSKLNLRKWVQRHQELIRMVVDLEVLYSRSTLFNIITSSVLICLSGFNMTALDDITLMATFGLFLIMSLSQIFLLCFFGDMLMTSSASVSSAIYSSQWYNADSRTKKSVLLVLIRAQKPCKLTAANFADLNLRAFTTILSRSWSYFALLKTMYD